MNAAGLSDALRIALAAVISFAVVVGITPFVRRIAVANGITDRPGDDRWRPTPTPYLGGVALVVGSISAMAVLPDWEADAIALLLGAVTLALVGLVDDFRTVAPMTRVRFEVAAGIIAFLVGARVELFNTAIDLVLTVVWFVVVTNAFNLLDNSDGGLASIVTVVAAAIATVALAEGQVLVGGLAIVVAAACLGFLRYNWHPAQILMGDAGSLFLGFLVAGLALELRPPVPHAVSAVGLVLLLGAALFDTALVVISRLAAGRSILIGGTDHTSHRLMRLGLGPQATAVLLGLSASAMAGAGALVSLGLLSPLVGAGVVGAPCLVCGARLLLVPVYGSPARRSAVELT